MARITDLDPIGSGQVDINADQLILSDVTGTQAVDKKIAVSELHKTAPAATPLAAGVVSTGAQTFSGDKTFQGNVTVQGTFNQPIDSTPTANSARPATSGGIKTYVDQTVAGAVGAGFTHNIPRLENGLLGKNITAYYQDGTLWQRIAGTNGFAQFEDIYVGDYFQLSRPITTPNQASDQYIEGTQWVTIAGINTLAGNGDSVDMWQNHLVMIPGRGEFPEKNYFGRNRMNPTDTAAGGYLNSELHQQILGPVVSAGSTAAGATVNQQLYAEFGAHLKTTRELLTNAVGDQLVNRLGSASGATSGWEWASCQSVLMSEVEVFGATIWGSSAHDVGTGKARLPLFNFSTKALNNRWSWYWLKAVASSFWFASVGSAGESYFIGASNAGSYVRPRFVLGA